jgi:hypothetical protein
MLASDAAVDENPQEVILETYVNPDGVTCRLVQLGNAKRIDRWHAPSSKWLQWLQSGETNEILFHRSEKEKVQKDLDDVIAERDTLRSENAALKSKKP